MRRETLAMIFLAPLFFGIFLFKLYPIYYSLILSFSKIRFSEGSIVTTFSGLENWREILVDPSIHNVILVTTEFVAVTVVGGVLSALFLALVLNVEFKGKRIFRVLCLIPWAMPSVIAGQVWRWLLNGEYGLVNTILLKLNLIDTPHVWLADPSTALLWVMIAEIWKTTPFTLLMFLASLQLIPQQLYDAATIDGAGRLQRLRYVTIPIIKPTLLFVVILRIIWNFKAFDVIYMLTKGGPYESTMVYYFYVWTQTFKYFNFGYGAALAYTLTIFLFVLTLLYIKVSRYGEIF